MDDLFEGWDGLPRVTDQLDTLLPPARRRAARAATGAGTGRATPGPRPCWSRRRRCWCWRASARAARTHADLITVLAWVEVPYDLRMARGLERGGVGVAENWRQWAVDEQELFARERTRERADVVLDGRVGSLQA